VGFKEPDLRGGEIDYLFIPFWYFVYATGPKTIKDKLPTKNIIVTHTPEAEPLKKYFAVLEDTLVCLSI
jgi:hypothetical protein